MVFPLQWLLLLSSMGSRCAGFSSCSMWTHVAGITGSVIVVPRLSYFSHMGCSQTKNPTIVSSIDRWVLIHCCCLSVAQSCLILCDPMDCSTAGLPVPHHLPESAQVIFIALVMPSSHLILWHLLLLLPSIFPRIKDFSNEPSVHIRWPKYGSFSFTIRLSS